MKNFQVIIDGESRLCSYEAAIRFAKEYFVNRDRMDAVLKAAMLSSTIEAEIPATFEVVTVVVKEV